MPGLRYVTGENGLGLIRPITVWLMINISVFLMEETQETVP